MFSKLNAHEIYLKSVWVIFYTKNLERKIIIYNKHIRYRFYNLNGMAKFVLNNTITLLCLSATTTYNF